MQLQYVIAETLIQVITRFQNMYIYDQIQIIPICSCLQVYISLFIA